MPSVNADSPLPRRFTIDNGRRPPFSYISLVIQAIKTHPTASPTYNEIISSIKNRYLYYRQIESTDWKQRIRHALVVMLLDLGEIYRDPTDKRWRLRDSSINAIAG